ncbi:MAG: endonuclease/exonuclease/phosphatase family protein [Planctomycetaceae bacterium]
MRNLFEAAGVIGMICSTLAFAGRIHWIADLCANLRVQLLIGLLVTALASAFSRRFRIAALQLVFAAATLPALSFGIPRTSEAGGTVLLRVTTANVLTTNRRYDDIQAEILEMNPDVVAIVELGEGLARHLGADFQTQYRFSNTSPDDHGNFGIGLYSRYPLEDCVRLDLLEDDLPTLAATVVKDDQRFHVVAVHTLPPMSDARFRHRNDHLKQVAAYVTSRRNNHPKIPVVVMGDFNLTPWSPIYHQFAAEAGLTSDRLLNWKPTWYAFPGFPFGLVLDHVFTTADLTSIGRNVSPEAGSDHRFVTVDLAGFE